MDEIKGLLGKVSEGLRALGDIFIALGKQFERKAETVQSEEAVEEQMAEAPKPPRRKASSEKKDKKDAVESKRKPGRKKKTQGASIAEDTGAPMAAYEVVFEIIKDSEDGASVAALMEQTGFNSKKIANCVNKLKGKGLVRSVEKGVYVVI